MRHPSADEIVTWYTSVRRRTRLVAERIPETLLERSPAAGRFTPGDLVRHIAGTERWMWGENAQLRPSRYPGHAEELARGLPEVLAYLDRLQDETSAIIAGLDDAALTARCETVGGVDMRVWKWLRLMIEHQIHHRGQLYEVLGAAGVATPPIYGLTEPEVRARSQ